MNPDSPVTQSDNDTSSLNSSEPGVNPVQPGSLVPTNPVSNSKYLSLLILILVLSIGAMIIFYFMRDNSVNQDSFQPVVPTEVTPSLPQTSNLAPTTNSVTVTPPSGVALIGAACTETGYRSNPTSQCLLVDKNDNTRVLKTLKSCENTTQCMEDAQSLAYVTTFYLGIEVDGIQYIIEEQVDDASYRQMNIYLYNFENDSLVDINNASVDLLGLNGERPNTNCYDYYQDYAYSAECITNRDYADDLEGYIKPFLAFRAKYGAKQCVVREVANNGDPVTQFYCPME